MSVGGASDGSGWPRYRGTTAVGLRANDGRASERSAVRSEHRHWRRRSGRRGPRTSEADGRHRGLASQRGACSRSTGISRGAQVVDTTDHGPLPFPDQSFELVTARHPVRPDRGEIRRVLVPGGHYFAQHVGPGSAFELIEFFRGPLPDQRRERSPNRDIEQAERAGLVVEDLKTARCRMEFYDVGAIV